MEYQYTWVIDSVDCVEKYMVVTYTLDVYPVTLNIPTPVAGADIPEYIKQFAPFGEWLRLTSPISPDLNQLIGVTGTETFVYPPVIDTPQGIGYLEKAEVSI